MLFEHIRSASLRHMSRGPLEGSPRDDGLTRETFGSVLEGFSGLIYNSPLKNISSLVFCVDGHHFSNSINILSTAFFPQNSDSKARGVSTHLALLLPRRRNGGSPRHTRSLALPLGTRSHVSLASVALAGLLPVSGVIEVP